MRKILLLFLFSFLTDAPLLAQVRPLTGIQPVADEPFWQEYHQAFPEIDQNPLSQQVNAVAVDRQDNVWIATRGGVYQLRKGHSKWVPQLAEAERGPAFDVLVDPQGTVWIAAWNGLYRAAGETPKKIQGIEVPVAAVCAGGGKVTAAGPAGLWVIEGEALSHQIPPVSRNIRALATDANHTLWVASGAGLFGVKDGTVRAIQDEKQLYSYELTSLATDPDGNLWVGGLGGITIMDASQQSRFITPEEGLPSIYVHAVARGEDGRMWVGTDRGVARFNGKSWSLRHSKRWLVDDNVRDIAFDSEGTAWIATAGGVSAIRRRQMTLVGKEAYFYAVNLRRHVREPWFVSECKLPVPGDTSRWEPQDDDNDGEYTAMYMAMESFKYAVTGEEQARNNARKAFETLRFLQTVTGTDGFFARTAVPAGWNGMHDPNRTYTPQERAEELVKDVRYKPVESRWRLSTDRQWLWKGDTSSDEATGHFYGYLFYYLLAADEKDKQDVRRHVGKLMDYIIASGYTLKDIDGTHTRWGVWAPEILNQDPDWAAERFLNSAELLSFLKVSYFITGNKKYEQAYRKLVQQHGYLENAKTAKRYDRSWNTHIDDILLSLTYPGLLLCEKNEAIRRVIRGSLDDWYAGIRADESPFFNFTYNLLSGEKAEVPASINYLRDAPLDLVNWEVDNSKREDIALRRTPHLDNLQTDRILPVSEQGAVRWDKNPWEAVKGDGGQTERTPVYWLLPYWMGRYLKIIE